MKLTPAQLAEALRQRQSELGSRTSEAKARAVRENGKKGGRPKKILDGTQPEKQSAKRMNKL